MSPTRESRSIVRSRSVCRTDERLLRHGGLTAVLFVETFLKPGSSSFHAAIRGLRLFFNMVTVAQELGDRFAYGLPGSPFVK